MAERLEASILTTFKPIDEKAVNAQLDEALKGFDRKIVVLDDDPTGVQTVHDISVYTDWSVDSMRKGFDEENSMFFILTNSRGLTAPETTKAHREMAENILQVAKETGKKFVVISRSDSTLRGHYPLEPEILKDVIESGSDQKIDGEIIYPFFKEGGRFTIGNVHYVQEGDVLVPAQVKDFNKIVVNSIDYADVKVFAIALVKAMNQGKNFIFRSAAAITKVLGGVTDKPILSHDELILTENRNGGIIVVGSHVNKTTAQLEELKNSDKPIEFIEFNQHRVLEENGLEQEVERVVSIVDADIKAGKTVAVYTRRDRFDLDTDDKDEQLKVSVKISDAVTSIITNLSVRPNFIVAKGGITSSDIGTKALRVQKANVMGQIKPGIPVWMTGEESKFPGLPYVIFPGNVGTNTTLREAVETLMGE